MSKDLLLAYRKKTKKRGFFIAIMLVLMLILFVLALFLGSMNIGFNAFWQSLFFQKDEQIFRILMNIRLPKIVGALVCGTALSVSGAVMQSILKNPLASPFTLGISGSAAFGAAFAIMFLGAGSQYTGSHDVSTIINPYVVTVSAFAWSLISVLVILAIVKLRGSSPEMIILSGIIISSLFGAGISAMQYFADDVQLSSIVFWTFGDVSRAGWREIWIQMAVVVPVLIYFIKSNWNYKSLHSGDEYATSIGVNPRKIRVVALVLASLITAVVVSVYGVVAFVGLVVPHIVRKIIGKDELFVIPGSALFGAFFLLLSDTVARTVISPVILPVGILTSFLGAPLFLMILIYGMKKR